MPERWLTIEVHLVAGGGLELDPPPGRVFLVGPSTTFGDLAEAIDVAFARWDRGHLHEFTLADGRLVGHAATGEDEPVEEETTLRVADAAAPGEAFLYLFDFGEDWEHHCLVIDDEADPEALLGERPDSPVVIDGWGWVPDQYGRESRDGDPGGLADAWPLLDGYDSLAADLAALADEPDQVLVDGVGPGERPVDEILPGQDAHVRLRGAVVRGDGEAAVQVLRDEPEGWRLLQLAGDGLLLALQQGVAGAERLVVDCTRRLDRRGWSGDAELAAQLEHARGEGPTPMLRTVEVDLSELAGVLDGDPAHGSAWLNVRTGELLPLWDDDDLELEDGVEVVPRGPSAIYRDMVDFTDDLSDRALADLLHEAIQGRGAFRQFKDIVFSHDTLGRRWRAFSEERERGRARSWLASNGYRPRVTG